MRAADFICAEHEAHATEFCLCGKSPVYLCATCLPKHADKSSHDAFSMGCLELFGALGNDKAELKHRIEIVKHCNDFLDNASAREAAVITEANNLIAGLVQCYQEWLGKNHRCFSTLVGNLREEVSLLLKASQVVLSPLAQTLAKRSLSLTNQEENLLCFIPEENALKELTQKCNQALTMKAARVEQSEYEEEVQRSFSELPPPIQQASEQGDAQKLIAVLEDHVRCFDVTTSQWQPLCALHRNINVDKGTSSTFIPPTTIFVCGGVGGFWQSSNRHVVSNCAYMLQVDNGSVQELPHMSAGRCFTGVTWDSGRKALYVFGGADNRGTCYTDRLRTSEMFLSNEWSPLPEMHQSRDCFNPCWHSCLVYLCGGYETNSVETYDPRSNTFALQDFTLPEGTETTAVVECGVLTVISKNYISKLQQGRLTSQKHPEYDVWSNCTPVVSGGMVYVTRIGDYCSRCIDLTTGALRKEVSYI